MNAAIIPARGGSKRIPRKNIRPFRGRPVIAWSILAAREAECFSRIIVSTEDDEIAEIARAHGAEVPFLRPADLADDVTGTTKVIAHATEWLAAREPALKAVCCIYATAPFVHPQDIRDGLSHLESGGWAYVLTATEYPAPIFRAFRDSPGGGIEMFFPEAFSVRSQDLPLALHDAGQFYWGRPEAWMKQEILFDRHSFAMRVPRWRVHDIDTEDDWKRAELFHKTLSPSESRADS